MLNAKFRKLIKDPNLFFSDMVKNKKRKIKNTYTMKEEGNYQYSIVSAVYNVGRYLDDYFKSLVNQKLNFRKHIHLIMVDDGSIDNSAEIIKKWQRKYPGNITYVWQENEGQSAARNTGLEYVKTEWVTFIDPDDFVSLDYFLNIDKALSNNHDNKIKVVSCNIIMYLESKKIYKDNHPLNYKYAHGDSIVDINKSDNEIQLSASSALFSVDIINSEQLLFDSRVKPNFEDAHFISKYLLNVDDGCILFMKSAEYFYRKREDGTSTLDTSWTKPERFINVPEFGYLDTLRMYKKNYGVVPSRIQKTILYEVLWYVKHLDNRPERTHFLNEYEKEYFISKMKEIFSYIDCNIIMSFNLAGIWFYHKLAMLSFFKNEMPDFQISYIDRYDPAKELVRVRYFSNKNCNEQFLVDGQDSIPLYSKITLHEFVGEELIEERWAWLSIHEAKNIEININNVPTSISVGGKQYKGPVLISDIVGSLIKQIPKFSVKRKYDNSWILMDRDMQADDNAEHLYKYIRDNHPEQKIYFALRKESHDWMRLKNDGFDLLDFDSPEHRLALGTCKKVISSHANYYVTNLLGPKMLLGRHFVFLQHGVTKDDISSWLNTKDNIDCFITASPHEYESICCENSKYNFSNKEVFLTGFPRHDYLINNAEGKENLIIIMPTWRSNIVGPVLGDGDSRGINPNFMESKFASYWKKLLHSDELKTLLEQSGFKAAFFPHVNIRPYLELFDIPEYIDVITSNDCSIQELFVKSSIMITDYSSVAFEMAVQDKQTIYYQFDEDEFFSEHNYVKGYFDYRLNGFGPVVTNQESLLQELSNCISNRGIPSEEILSRINDMFPVRDNQNCARTYEAIKSLDSPSFDRDIYLVNLKKAAIKATSSLNWLLAEKRWKKHLDLISDSYLDESVFESIDFYFQALSEQGKNVLLDKSLSKYLPDNSDSLQVLEKYALLMSSSKVWSSAEVRWEMYLDICTEVNPQAIFCYFESLRNQGRLYDVEQLVTGLLRNNDDKLRACLVETQALLFMSQHLWLHAIHEWEKIGANKLWSLNYYECLAYSFQYDLLDDYISHINYDGFSSSQLSIVNVLSLYARQDWLGIIDYIDKESIDLKSIDLLSARILIVKSCAYRQLNEFDKAHNCLALYEHEVKNDPECRYEIANLAFQNEKWAKVISQLNKACAEYSMLPNEFKILYLKALLFSGLYADMEVCFSQLSEDFLLDLNIIKLRGEMYLAASQFSDALDIWLLLDQSQQELMISEYLLQLTENGKHTQTDEFISDYLSLNTNVSLSFIEVWALSATNLMVWSSAEYRWAEYCKRSNNNCLAIFSYLYAIMKQRRYLDVENKISELNITGNIELQKCILNVKALIFMSKHMWADAIRTWRILGKDHCDNLSYCECLAYEFNYDELDYISSEDNTDNSNNLAINVLSMYAHKNWEGVIELLNLEAEELQNESNIASRLLIIKSAAYRNLGELDLAYKCLFLYEAKVKDDCQCRFEIARVSFASKQWRKVITQLDKASLGYSSLPIEFKSMYLMSLYLLGFYSRMESIFDHYPTEVPPDINTMRLRANMYMSLGKWNEALSEWNSIGLNDPEAVYAKALVLKNLGAFDEAFQMLKANRPIDTVAAWELRAELAQINDDWEEAYKCFLRAKWKREGSVSITSDNIENLSILRS